MRILRSIAAGLLAFAARPGNGPGAAGTSPGGKHIGARPLFGRARPRRRIFGRRRERAAAHVWRLDLPGCSLRVVSGRRRLSDRRCEP